MKKQAELSFVESVSIREDKLRFLSKNIPRNMAIWHVVVSKKPQLN